MTARLSSSCNRLFVSVDGLRYDRVGHAGSGRHLARISIHWSSGVSG